MKYFRLIVFITVIIFLTSCSSPVLQSTGSVPKLSSVAVKVMPGETFFSSNYSIVALGDSLTKGVGDEEKQSGYIGYLQKQLSQISPNLEIEVYNFATAGHKTTNLLQKLEDKGIEEKIIETHLIVLTIGANDIMQVLRDNFSNITLSVFESEKKDFQDRFRRIITEIRSLNDDAEIIYVGLYNPFKFSLSELAEIDLIISNWNQAAIEVLAEDINSSYVKIDDIFVQNQDGTLLSEDNFHPNHYAYSLMGKRVYDKLRTE